MPFPISTLAELSHSQAQLRGQAIAFWFGSRSSTYSQLNAHANQIANGLLLEGLDENSRVAILGKDSDFHYEVLFGCAKAKTVFTCINWRLSPKEITYILNDSESKILFVTEEYLSLVETILPDLQFITQIIGLNFQHSQWRNFINWRKQFSPEPPALSYSPDDVIVQMYTSGTTGHPKGVLLANRCFFTLMRSMLDQGDEWMDLNPHDKLLVALPQFHMGGIWWAVQGVIVGAQSILIETFVAWQVLELIEKHHITKVEMVPAMLQTTLSEPSCQTTDLSSVQGLLYGGSPISPSLLQRAMAAFKCAFFQIYGMTETGNMAVCLRPEDHDLTRPKLLESAGRPLPNVQIRILDPNNQTLPPTQLGEIWIHSPSNMLGYWKNERATQDVLQNGWIRTGDAGYIDQDGYLFVCDRIKDMIIYGGENIYPAEIENALSLHPAVSEAAVIGVPDERWGELVKAFVVLRPDQNLKQRELINFVRQHIADFKAPKSIEFIDKLPRNPSGKILKRILREPYWQSQQRQVN